MTRKIGYEKPNNAPTIPVPAIAGNEYLKLQWSSAVSIRAFFMAFWVKSCEVGILFLVSSIGLKNWIIASIQTQLLPNVSRTPGYSRQLFEPGDTYPLNLLIKAG